MFKFCDKDASDYIAKQNDTLKTTKNEDIDIQCAQFAILCGNIDIIIDLIAHN